MPIGKTLPMGHIRLSLLALTVLCAAAGAAPPKFNVDLSIGWEGSYRPMEWTPVDVTIATNLKKPFGGTLTISAQQDDLTVMTIDHKIVLTPDLPLHVPLVTKLAFVGGDCRVTIRDDGGRLRWRGNYSVYRPTPTGGVSRTVSQGALLIGVVGRPGFGLMYLHRRSQCTSRQKAGGVHVKRKPLRMLPWDWTGYASLDLLVLYDVDFEQMNDHQAKAIVAWVTGGGKLLIVLGGHPLSPKHSISSLLPFRLGPVREVKVPTGTIAGWGCETGRQRLKNAVACWSIPSRLGRRWETVWTAGEPGDGPPDAPAAGGIENAPFFAHGPAGLGRVGVLTCDPSAVGGRQRENLAKFWVGLAGRLLDGRGISHTNRVMDPDSFESEHEYELGIASNAANVVLEHLLGIPELRPLSIWVVIVLLLALAVVIGPVDYLVLKWLDRLPLTWVTSAACVVLFTVGAYYGVQALRGGTAQVRMVSVLDGVEGTDGAWRTTYSGIFAPASDNYRLTGLKANQWWSSVVPTEGSRLYSFASKTVGREIRCFQSDGANLPTSVPISIWTMQCLISEAPAEGLPLEGRLRLSGDRVTLTIINRSEKSIRGGGVRVGENRRMSFGPVEAKSSEEFTGRLKSCKKWEKCLRDQGQADPWEMHMRPSGPFTGDQAYFAWGSLRRTDAMLGYLRRGAAVICARYDDAPAEFALVKRKGEFSHIQMVRLVVFPQEGSSP